MEIEPDSYLVGFFSGLVVSLILAGLAGRFNRNRGAAQRSGQKASVTVKGEKSPGEIVGDAAKASMRAILWGAAFVLCLIGVIWFLAWVATG